MPIESHDLLRFANELDPHRAEVHRRAAVSRAYYAAYHRCLEWERALPAIGDDRGVQGVHARLISRLRNPHHACDASAAARSRLSGDQLETQRCLRVAADYKLKRYLSVAMLREQLMLAAAVIERCDQSVRQPVTAFRSRSADTKPPHPHSPSRRAS